jgi:type VI protein secretion system component Hcp
MKSIMLGAVVTLSVLLVQHVGRAALIGQFDLAGLGTNIPVNGFTWGFTHINPSAHAGGEAQKVSVHDFTLLRTVDSYSPTLINAVLTGTVFPSATIAFYKTSISTSAPYVYFDLQHLIAESYSSAGSWGGTLLAENVSFAYGSVTAHYRQGGQSDKPNPWGTVMPLVWPGNRNPDDTVDLTFSLTVDGPSLPAGVAPDFPFTPDLLHVVSPSDPNFLYTAEALDGTVSLLGEVLPPTLPVPEPSTAMLIVLGVFGLVAWRLRTGGSLLRHR